MGNHLIADLPIYGAQILILNPKKITKFALESIILFYRIGNKNIKLHSRNISSSGTCKNVK